MPDIFDMLLYLCFPSWKSIFFILKIYITFPIIRKSHSFMGWFVIPWTLNEIDLDFPFADKSTHITLKDIFLLLFIGM